MRTSGTVWCRIHPTMELVMAKMIRLMPMCIFLFYLADTHAGEDFPARYQIGTLPSKIHEEVVKVGCSPVHDYYSSALVKSPPYIREVFSDFVAICEETFEGGQRNYRLVIKAGIYQNYGYFEAGSDQKGVSHPFRTCPSSIVLPYRPLGFFLRPDEIIRKHDGTPRVTDNLFEIYTDAGDIEMYSCVDGQWETSRRPVK